jgi:hypothetical protein
VRKRKSPATSLSPAVPRRKQLPLPEPQELLPTSRKDVAVPKLQLRLLPNPAAARKQKQLEKKRKLTKRKLTDSFSDTKKGSFGGLFLCGIRQISGRFDGVYPTQAGSATALRVPVASKPGSRAESSWVAERSRGYLKKEGSVPLVRSIINNFKRVQVRGSGGRRPNKSLKRLGKNLFFVT